MSGTSGTGVRGSHDEWDGASSSNDPQCFPEIPLLPFATHKTIVAELEA